MSVEAAVPPNVVTLLVTVVGGVLGGVVASLLTHLFSRRRDLEQKRREFVLKYLIEAWRGIEVSSRDDVDIKEKGPALEKAIADIQLFGSPSQIEKARKISAEMASIGHSDTTPLINDLRDDLRKQLALPKAQAQLVFLRIKPKPKIEPKHPFGPIT